MVTFERIENQARGAFHVHALVWLKDDPGICDLVKTAMAGHVAKSELEELEKENDVGEDDEKVGEQEPDSEEVIKLKEIIKEGLEAKKIVEKYYDYFITAQNPLQGGQKEFDKAI